MHLRLVGAVSGAKRRQARWMEPAAFGLVAVCRL